LISVLQFVSFSKKRNRALRLPLPESPRCRSKAALSRPFPSQNTETDDVQFTKLDIFGHLMVPGQDPSTIISLDLWRLRGTLHRKEWQ
jgi:hypothetical protein